MKFKKMIALLLCVATMFTLVSAEVYAANYTVTIKSNDGTTSLFTATVASGTVITFTTNGLSLSTGENYVYSGEKDFLGFNTVSGQTVVTYAAGMTYTVTNTLTLYLVEGEKLAHTIVGDSVPGAEVYELYHKSFDLVLPEEYSYYLMARKVSSVDGLTYYYVFLTKDKSPKITYNTTSGYFIYKSYNANGVGASSTISLRDAYEKALSNLETGASWALSMGKNLLYSNIDRASNADGGASIDLSHLNEYVVTYTLLDSSEELCFDMLEYDVDAGANDILVKAKGAGYYDSDYSNIVEYTHVRKYDIAYTAINASIVGIDGGSAASEVYEGRPLSVKIKPAAGYLQPDSVTVTMNGSALSSSKYVYYPETGNLVIFSITGDVEITAEGIMKVAAPGIENDASLTTKEHPIVLTFEAVENASGYSVYVNGVKTTAVDTSIEDGVVMAKVRATVFPKSNTYQFYVVAEPADGYVGSDPSNTIAAMVAVQIATPVATERADLKTAEHPFVCEVTKPANATALTCYVNGNPCGVIDYEVESESGNWIVYIPMSVFTTSGDYEIYFVAHGSSTDFVESESSNRLTYTISKLATPVIWLE